MAWLHFTKLYLIANHVTAPLLFPPLYFPTDTIGAKQSFLLALSTGDLVIYVIITQWSPIVIMPCDFGMYNETTNKALWTGAWISLIAIVKGKTLPATAMDTLYEEVFAKLQGQSTEILQKKNVDEKVADVYSKVGLMLSRYRSGKIPKAFKIVPRLKNWEEILGLTQPENWTPNATYQATRIFISGLNPKFAEVFLTTILLPKIRQDISINKKLNSHYYEALKKSIYKPAAFFKGIVLALCSEPDCTLKEATIIASVVSKMSIPVLHSAATLLKLAQGDYSGPRSIFIKTLIDKKYALPQRAVASMVEYFEKFNDNNSKLPVLWHQSLLVFAQRYKKDLTVEQRSSLLNLLTDQHHEQISAEIVRELEQGAAIFEKSTNMEL